MSAFWNLNAILIFALLNSYVLSAPSTTQNPDDYDDEESGSEPSQGSADDGRIYKNPRNSPSAICPRDEEQATLLGQKCLRKCSSDEDCKSKKKKCLCDGACGMSCIKPDRECPELEQPEIGAVSLSGRLFGDKATYSCPHGYHVVGLQSRSCQADGQWAGQTPSCKENIYCLQPPTIEHARHSALPEQATFDLDATVQYHCHTGYVTNGFPRAKCLAIDGHASWYGPDISCEPRSCGPPGEVPHGWVTAECHTFGCRALLQCGPGFELVGKAERHCQADGTWAPKELPTCVLVTAVQCPPPEAPRHGKAIYTSCAYNSVVSYECKYGYKLVGDSTRRCGADKTWSGTQPQCKEINCGHPGQLYNGWLENISAGTGLGASLIFRCHDNMRMIGNSSAVCQANGTWTHPLPKCMAPCVVPHVTQGRVVMVAKNYTNNLTEETATQIIGSSTMVRHGDQILVMCDKNYEFPYAEASVTCNNGTWTHIPKCQPARCKRMPKPPRDGMVVAPKTEHGMKAKFRCKDGFELQGNPVVNCSYGNWTGEIPKCHQVYCPFPGYILNGKVLLVGNMGLYDYRPYVKKVVNNKQIMYDCDKGYVLSEGPPGATCIGGFWRPQEMPNCTLGEHPRIRLNRRRRSLDPSKDISIENHPSPLHNKDFRNIRKFDIQVPNDEIFDYDPDDEAPMTVLTVFNVHGLPTGHRVYYNTPEPPGVSSGEQKSSSTILLKGGVFNREDLVKPSYNRFSDLSHLTNSYLRSFLDPSTRRTLGLEDVETELIPDETKNELNLHDDKDGNRIKRSIPRSEVETKQYMEDKILKDLAALSPDFTPVEMLNDVAEKRVKRHDMGLIIGNNSNEISVERDLTVLPLDMSNSSDSDLTKRGKRTSGKVVKINQTLGGAKKTSSTGRDHKGKSYPPSPYDTSSSGEDPDSEEGKTDEDSKKEDDVQTSSEKPGRKPRIKAPCEALSSDPYVNVEVVKLGRDPNMTNSSGTIVRVVCGKGYQLNLEVNATAKCVRGRWKPERPECREVPCYAPATPNGVFANNDGIEMNESKPISSGEVVRFSCQYGYTVQGPSNLRCWLGEWAVTSMPECTPASCSLPPARGGGYGEGYRAGLRVSHAALVTLTCHADPSTPITITCHLGRLKPDPVSVCHMQGVTSDFLSGSDIVRENVSELEPTSDRNSSECGTPIRIEGTLLFQDGLELSQELPDSYESDSLEYRTFYHGSEITYKCLGEKFPGDSVSWVAICERGVWVGDPRDCDTNKKSAYTLLEATKDSCTFSNSETNVVSFYRDVAIKEPKVIFPHGAEILSRCTDIGKYSMTGSPRRMCLRGSWDYDAPLCTGLNQEKDYAMEHPPTILFRHQLGPIAQSNDGKLIVYPGTILHMECLWMRRFGNPKWTYGHNSTRKYPEGWTTDPGRDSQLEYRLSIINAVPEDSGIYKCETPARQWHQVDIVVDAVHCPALPLLPSLIPSTLANKLNTEVHFTCANSETLVGPQIVTCLPNGNWSDALPRCESVECPDVEYNSSVPESQRARVSLISRIPGARAAFSCPNGRILSPSRTKLTCGPTGQWHGDLPKCVEVTCPPLDAPQYGYTLGRAPHKAGDVLQFHCNPEHTLHGRPILVCQDSGRWSDRPPTCTQACTYPGTTISGRMSSVKFYYRIGETITFTCEQGYKLKGSSLLECLKSRKWSNTIPLCVPMAKGNLSGETQALVQDLNASEAPINISKRGVINQPVPATLSATSYKLGLMRATADRLLRRATLQTWKNRASQLYRIDES